MNNRNFADYLFTSLFVVLLLACISSATTNGPYSNSVSFSSDLESSAIIELPSFDISGGSVLTDVLVELFHSGQADISADNDDPLSPSLANARIIRTWSLSGFGVSGFGTNTETSSTVALSADNGDFSLFDPAGPDGVDFGTLSYAGMAAGSFNPSTSLYETIGSGIISFSVSPLLMINDIQFATTSKYQTQIANPDLTVTAQVTYTYNPIPEPATVMLLGAGCLGLLSKRRNR